MLPHRQPIAKRRLCNQQPRISTNGVRRLIQFFVSFVLPVGKSTIISSLSFLLAFLLSCFLASKHAGIGLRNRKMCQLFQPSSPGCSSSDDVTLGQESTAPSDLPPSSASPGLSRRWNRTTA